MDRLGDRPLGLRLGQGSVIVDGLRATDRARLAGDLMPEQVATIRKDILKEIIGAHLSWCTHSDPTPDDRLSAEVKRVLAEVKLTSDERAAVEAALPKLHGEPFSGG